MSDARDETRPGQADTPASPSNVAGSSARDRSVKVITCPSWCIYPGECAGDHASKAWGTVATGGLSPEVDGPEPPRHNTVVVRTQYPESDGLPPGVALFGVHRDHDFQVDLTLREARVLLEGLTAAIATAESD